MKKLKCCVCIYVNQRLMKLFVKMIQIYFLEGIYGMLRGSLWIVNMY